MTVPGVARYAVLPGLVFALSTSLDAQPVHAVERVVDGDTVVLQDVGTVRLIGVDTPETQDPREPVQHFGLEAATFLRSLLDGQTVRLDYDEQRRDSYQRTLAYLYLADGTFVNREIIRQGYGHAYVTHPFRYLDDFRAAEAEAREAGRGLWAPIETQPAKGAAPQQVWVNSSSRVYHCPGTRYYGTTARGAYMTEAEARERGHRPAYGRQCFSDPGTPSAPATASPATPPAARLTSETASVRVWVNTSSRVYHCPGTRYYGNTARGEYLGEAEAEARGHRPAYGKRCGPPTPVRPPLTATASPAPQAAPAVPDVRVWVNTGSGVYHCPGSRYYGTTKQGAFMGQRDAHAQGHRPAGGRACS